jgi:hypothetical protein
MMFDGPKEEHTSKTLQLAYYFPLCSRICNQIDTRHTRSRFVGTAQLMLECYMGHPPLTSPHHRIKGAFR